MYNLLMKKAYKSSSDTHAPLSGAIEANGFVFISGQIHLNKEGMLEGKTIEEKFGVIMGNVKNILSEAGLSVKDVVRVQLYLTDISELPALNKIYGNYFEDPLPARTSIGITALPLGATLEMDLVAARM